MGTRAGGLVAVVLLALGGCKDQEPARVWSPLPAAVRPAPCGPRSGRVVGLGGAVGASGEQMAPPDATGGLAAVAAGDYHALGIRRDGELIAWGRSEGGALGGAGLGGVVQIAASGEHAIALLADGSVTSWGAWHAGIAWPARTPAAVGVAVGSSYGLTLVLGADGKVRDHLTWSLAHAVDLPPVKQIAAAQASWYALHEDGSVSRFVEGDLSPHAVAIDPVNSIVAGGTFVAGVRADGTVAVAAQDAFPSRIDQPPPGLGGVVALAAGPNSLVAVRADGSMVSWDTDGASPFAAPPGVDDVISAAAGFAHAVLQRRDGSVAVVWRYGGGPPQNLQPLLAGPVVAIAAGENLSLALLAGGRTYAWGEKSRAVVPGRPQVDVTDAVAVAAGGQHTLALREDGTVVAGGDDTYGQATVPAGLSGVAAIAAGETHSLALRRDGSVVAWGNPDSGGTDVPADLDQVVAIAAGVRYSVALRFDGTIVGWGEFPTPPLRKVKAIAAGSRFALALQEDGTLTGWGFSPQHPPSLRDVTGIACTYGGCIAQRGGETTVWPAGTGAYFPYWNAQPPVWAGDVQSVAAVTGGTYHLLAITCEP